MLRILEFQEPRLHLQHSTRSTRRIDPGSRKSATSPWFHGALRAPNVSSLGTQVDHGERCLATYGILWENIGHLLGTISWKCLGFFCRNIWHIMGQNFVLINWWFPEIGVPPVIISFIDGFSLVNHSFWVPSWPWKPPLRIWRPWPSGSSMRTRSSP